MIYIKLHTFIFVSLMHVTFCECKRGLTEQDAAIGGKYALSLDFIINIAQSVVNTQWVYANSFSVSILLNSQLRRT